jgi:DNA-binding NtrC family response regulator
VFHIHLPPLRERREDIAHIAEFLIGELNRKHSCKVSDVSQDVMEGFLRHNWPGNVRELRNVLERAVILAGEGTVEMKHMPATLQNRAATPATTTTATDTPGVQSDLVQFSIGTTVEEAEKGLILRTLEHTKNNKTRAAEILGISLKTLHNKLKEDGSKEASVVSAK